VFLTPPAINWTIGDSQTYSFLMKSSARAIDARTGIPSSSVSEITGKLGFRIFNIKDGIVNTGFQLEVESATVNDKDVDAIKKLYSYPVYVDFNMSGKPLKIYTSNGVSRDDENFIKGLIYYIQYIYSPPAMNWEEKENDVNGRYISSYTSKINGDVEKKRRVAPQHKGDDERNGKSVVSFSLFKYYFNEKWSWISGLNGKEKWKTTRSDMSSTSSLEIELIAEKKGLNDSSALFGEDIDYSKTVAGLDVPGKKSDSIWEEMRLEKAGEVIKFDSYLEFISLFQKNKISSSEFIRKITDYLKIHKNGAFKLADMIIYKKVNDNTGDLLMYSMGNAGTLECQKSLFSLTSEKRLTHWNRTRAAVYLGDLKSPDESIIQSMKSFPSDYSDKNNAFLSSAMVCSMGRISSLMNNEGPLADDINNYLRQKLNSSSTGVSERCSVLNAVSNTGDISFINEINRDRGSSDSFVRSTAVGALVNMEGSAVDRALLDTVLNDVDPMVRKQAIKVQEQKGYNEQFVDELISLYGNEKEAEVRLAMVSYFRSVKSNDGSIIPFLEKSLKNESDPDVRILLLKAIHSSK
jgi:hypothetical protein